MKAAHYASVQTELLVAVELLRRLPLDEFADQADELGNLGSGEMARRARAMCNCGPHGPKKAVRSQVGQQVRRQA